MARNVEGPWYRASKGTWYATVGGKNVSLQVRGETSRAEAVRAWHRLMAGVSVDTVPTPKVEQKKPIPEAKTANELTVRQLADMFLADAESRLKPNSLVWYRHAINGLGDAFGSELPVYLTHRRIEVWLAGRSWGNTSRAHAIGILSIFFRWVEREGYIASNPIRLIRKPHARSRGAESVITDEVHQRLYDAASSTLRPMLTLLRETGARPSELARLTAADVDLVNSVAVLSEHKSAGKTGKPRLIFLSPEAVAVLRKLINAHPSGPLLRNVRGTAWTKDAIVLVFKRLSEKAGVKATSYGYRHSFATSALAKGVPDATVAALLGHSSTAMLHRHYSHLTSQASVMREALAKVRG